jgi:hypothetical protein
MSNGGVFSGLAVPLTINSDDVSIDDQSIVRFKNFAVNSTAPKPAHAAYAPFLVGFLIRQIDSIGRTDDKATVHIFGEASATGPALGNAHLAQGRADAIGRMLKAEFDKQKGASGIARKMTMVIDAKGTGDARARDDRDTRLSGLVLNTSIDKMQNDYREAYVNLSARHVVVDDDLLYDCRMVYNIKLDTKKVPANELERVLDDMETKLGSVGTFLAKFGFDQLKSYVVKTLKETVKPLFEDFPEIAIVYESIDFIVPSDLNLCFQFRNHQGTMGQYQYSGTENKKALDLFDCVSKLIGMLKWLTKINDALEKVDKLGKQFDGASDAVKKLKQATGYLKKGLDDLLSKDGYIRKYLGDGVADLLLTILSSGVSGPLVIEASDWFAVTFEKKSVYAVSSFGGGARTETRELLGKAVVTLDFKLDGPEGLHHYLGTTVIHAAFSLQTGLLGFGFSKGKLRLM